MSDEEESADSTSVNKSLIEKNKFNIDKLSEILSKSVSLMYLENFKKSLDILKKLEIFLENETIEDINRLIPTKLIIIVLYNLSTCFYKMKY